MSYSKGNSETPHYKAIVIGGGFFGCCIATYLRECRDTSSLLLIEKNSKLLTRASLHNQARVHNGYHYPRSLLTALSSKRNKPKFSFDWEQSVFVDFKKLYAIANVNSKVNSAQFERFCDIADLRRCEVDKETYQLFNKRLISKVYSVDETAFDANKLRERALHDLNKYEIKTKMNSNVIDITACSNKICLKIQNLNGEIEQVTADFVFNCTYSGLNFVSRARNLTRTKLKHEIAEMGLVKMPEPLGNIGLTVMDGPFFSFMPYPAKKLHSLSHVRYTPHLSWIDEQGQNPYTELENYNKQSRVSRMIRDAARYMPLLSEAEVVDNFFEIKTVLQKNEGNDGRPILFEKSGSMPGHFAVLGGKIDNIYDVFEELNKLELN